MVLAVTSARLAADASEQPSADNQCDREATGTLRRLSVGGCAIVDAGPALGVPL